jgi:hypothetical protein
MGTESSCADSPGPSAEAYVEAGALKPAHCLEAGALPRRIVTELLEGCVHLATVGRANLVI